MDKANVYNCSLIPLKKTHNRAGNITIVQENDEVPFDVKKIFYLYDIPGGEMAVSKVITKGHLFIVAVSGSFDVEADDGDKKRIVTLNRPNFGFYLLPNLSISIKNFSAGAICLLLGSKETTHTEEDYANFINASQNK